jgi:hypothetical protein
MFQERTMPTINNVSVTNINSGANWVTGQYGTVSAPPPPTPPTVWVNATNNNQPPAGFLNNPAHQFVVQGNDAATNQAYVSGLLTIKAADCDPPLVYAFW